MAFLKTRAIVCLTVMAVLASGCGSRLKYQLAQSSGQIPLDPAHPMFLSGAVQVLGVGSTAGTTVQLENESDRVLVIDFSQPICAGCTEEAKDILQVLKSQGFPTSQAPDQVEVISIMLNSPDQDSPQATVRSSAQFFKDLTAVPWAVAYGDNRALYDQYCADPGHQIPCTLVQLPDKGIVSRTIGSGDGNYLAVYSKISALTGPWYGSPPAAASITTSPTFFGGLK